MALRVEPGDSADKFKVSGRGELHLSVLIENMRREGFELRRVATRGHSEKIDGGVCEPYEQLVLDIDEQHQGGVMEELGLRRAELLRLVLDGKGRVRLGVYGSRSRFDRVSFSVSDHDLGLGHHDPHL